MKGDALTATKPGKMKPCHGEAPTFINGGFGWIGVCMNEECKTRMGIYRLLRDAKKAWNAIPEAPEKSK